MSQIPEETDRYYKQGREAARLSVDQGELERLRTQSILTRYLPVPPATICDVGGAAGVYAFPLAQAGYEVHLVDPVKLHIEQAREHARTSGIALASITLGDARQMDFPASSADAALMLGPLYHLTDRSDRLQALREVRRILKSGGVLFAAAVSRFASLMDGLGRGFFADPEFRKIVDADLASGQHRNSADHPEYFTTAYFHRPEDLAGEAREAGFGEVQILALEGPVWTAARFHDVWNDPQQQQSLMKFLSQIEKEPSLVGASAHIMAVARNTTSTASDELAFSGGHFL